MHAVNLGRLVYVYVWTLADSAREFVFKGSDITELLKKTWKETGFGMKGVFITNDANAFIQMSLP